MDDCYYEARAMTGNISAKRPAKSHLRVLIERSATKAVQSEKSLEVWKRWAETIPHPLVKLRSKVEGMYEKHFQANNSIFAVASDKCTCFISC